MNNYSFFIEHEESPGNWAEYEYKVEIDGYEPYVPASVGGPPENSYPAEGGWIDPGAVYRRMVAIEGEDDHPWEKTEWSVFLEMHAAWSDFIIPEGRTALEVAEDAVLEELFDAYVEAEEAAYEAAMEARGDAIREGDWDD